MKLLVLGAGGIGGYFGGRLADAGADVTFLVRPRRRAQLEADGLRIRSPAGDATVRVKTVDAAALTPGYDAVLLTCKAYDLDSAMDAIAPAMSDHCCVIPMLNGFAHLERLDARFGRARVLGGTCRISARLRPDGLIVHAAPLDQLVFGERDRTRSARAEAFAAELARTSMAWELSDDIEQEMWEKLVMLSALAATTSLFRGSIREIMAAPGGREAIERTLAANVEIATREGHPPRAAALEFTRRGMTNPEGNWKASLALDLEAGGQVEGDHIVGWMLDRARVHGVDDTMLALAYTHIKTYEVRRAADG